MRMKAAFGFLVFFTLFFQWTLSGCNLFGGENPSKANPRVDTLPEANPDTNSNPKDSLNDTLKTKTVLAMPWSSTGLRLDTTFTITWDTSKNGMPESVSVALYQDSSLVFSFIESFLNSGNYSVDLPDAMKRSGYQFGSGEHFQLKLSSSLDSSFQIWSPEFKLIAPYLGNIGILAPKKDSIVFLDSTLTVIWYRTGDSGPKVGVQLLGDSAQMWTLDTSATNSGSFTIRNFIPEGALGNRFRIRVFSVADPSLSDTSESFFLTPRLEPTFAFIFPSEGDTLRYTDKVALIWKVENNYNLRGRVDLYLDSVKVYEIAADINLDTTQLNWILLPNFPAGNRYQIRLTQNGSQASASSAMFSIDGRTPDLYENDDSLSSALAIPLDTSKQWHNLLGNDIDCMKFKVDSSQFYAVQVQSLTQTWVSVLDSAGNSLVPDRFGTDNSFLFYPKVSGTVFLKIRSISQYLNQPPFGNYSEYSVSAQSFDWKSAGAKATLINPDSLSKWSGGSSYVIGWVADTLFYSNAMKLDLYLDSVFLFNISQALFTSATSQYFWTLPTNLLTSDRYQIRLSNLKDPRIHTTSKPFTINGIVDDAFEPDTSLATAKTMVPGDSVQKRILYANNPDWVTFRVKAGYSYYMLVDSRPSTVTYALYDSLQSLVTSSAGNRFASPYIAIQSQTLFARLTTTVTTQVNYQLRLLEVGPGASGLSNLSISPDSSNTFKTGVLQSITWLTDTLSLGNYVSLSVLKAGNPFSAITSSISNTGKFSWTIPSSFPSGSDYQIRVTSSLQPGLFGTGSRFSMDGATPDSFEVDNISSSAKRLTRDFISSKNLTYNDTDWFRIDGIPDSLYRITVTGNAYTYLTLMDTAARTIASPSGNAYSWLFKPTEAGPILGRIYAASPATLVEYQVALQTYPNQKHGLPLVVTSPDTTTIWASGSSYTATWEPDTALFSRIVTLALYLDTNFIVQLTSSITNSGTSLISIPAGLASSNQYRIRVSNTSSSLIYGSSQPFTISGIQPDSLEPNQSLAAAKTFAINQPSLPLSLTYQDQDWFRFTAKPQMLYQFRTTQTQTFYQSFELWSATGLTPVLSTSLTTLDTIRSVSWFSVSAGDYVFAIKPYSSSSSYLGLYGLELRELDADAYRFSITVPAADTTLTTSQTLAISWLDPAAVKGTVDIFLYKANTVVQTIASNASNTGTYNWVIPSLLQAGTDYSIRIVSRVHSTINGSSSEFEIAQP